MKTLPALCCAALAVTSANAQFRFGPEAGINFSAYRVQNGNSDVINKRPFAGLRVGGIVELALSNRFYLQPGMYYLRNGFGIAYDPTGNSGLKYSINTLELPLNVLVKTGKPGHNRFFIGGGAYFAYNFSGRNEATFDNQYYAAKMKIGYDKRSVVKPFDVGFNFNAGFETKWGVFMRAQVRTGIIDLSPGGQSNINFVNHNGSVTIGYLFGGKAKMKPEVTP